MFYRPWIYPRPYVRPYLAAGIGYPYYGGYAYPYWGAYGYGYPYGGGPYYW